MGVLVISRMWPLFEGVDGDLRGCGGLLGTRLLPKVFKLLLFELKLLFGILLKLPLKLLLKLLLIELLLVPVEC